MKLSRLNGGCWYCNQDNEKEPLFFCFEFDTYIHINCIQEKIDEVKEQKSHDPELEIIREEFGM